MRAVSQFTIHSLNDVYTGNAAPSNPYKGQLWVDTSTTPPVTKVYTGSAWKEQNGTDTIRSSVKTVEDKQAELETSLEDLPALSAAKLQRFKQSNLILMIFKRTLLR